MRRDTSDSWIRQLGPAPDSLVSLACFPFAGGSAGYFRPFQALLGPKIEVLAVQYPGRQDRRGTPAIEDISILAEQITDALSPWLARPLAFFGHSMGSVVGFEVARRLAQRGRRLPLVLFASGRRAPSRHRIEQLHLSEDAVLVAELRSLGGTDAALLADEELLSMILPAVRADYRAIETYRAPVTGAVLDIPITALVGDHDPRVSVEDARAWQEHTSRAFALHVLPGGHFYLRDQAADVARLIIDKLAQITPDVPYRKNQDCRS